MIRETISKIECFDEDDGSLCVSVQRTEGENVDAGAIYIEVRDDLEEKGVAGVYMSPDELIEWAESLIRFARSVEGE